MGKRRSSGDGSVYPQKKNGEKTGKWVASLDLGFQPGPANKRRRKRVNRVCETQVEARAALRELQRLCEQGVRVDAERQTLAAFLADWLDTQSTRLRPNTVQSYTSHVKHWAEALGSVQITKLAPQDVQAWLTRWQKDGLSPASVREIRAVLVRALKQAVLWGIVPRNVASLTAVPRGKPFEAQTLTLEQAQFLLNAIRGHRHEALYTVALVLGLRRGEVLGLTWGALSFEEQTISVRAALIRAKGTPQLAELKTRASRRIVAMSALVYDALVEHEARQRALGRDTRDPNGLVFTNRDGGPLQPGVVTEGFQALLKKLGLPALRFHDLRHTCATLMAAAGVSPRSAMEALGHSSITTTMNIYTKVLDSSKRASADAMDGLLLSGNGVKKRG